MKHEIIKTENYLLVVSDEEIKDLRPLKGKWHLEKGNIINQFPNYLTDLSECKLILCHLPLNGAPYLEGVDVLPEIEDEDEVHFGDLRDVNVNSFYAGYNKAKETYKYTEKDLRKAIRFGFNGAYGYLTGEKGTIEKQSDIYIQSLNQPKLPVAFECEMFSSDGIKSVEKDWYKIGKPKTITTLRGTEWVGTYKF